MPSPLPPRPARGRAVADHIKGRLAAVHRRGQPDDIGCALADPEGHHGRFADLDDQGLRLFPENQP